MKFKRRSYYADKVKGPMHVKPEDQQRFAAYDSNGRRLPLRGADRNAKNTAYKCKRCGSEFNDLATFNEHKREPHSSDKGPGNYSR